MKDIIEAILQNFKYIYPGFLFFSIYKYIKETDTEDINLYLLKIVCVSYILVGITDSIWQLISRSINCADDNVGAIVEIVCLLTLACILPFCAVRISKSKSFIKFLRWNKISIDTSKNDIELIESKRPENTIVYITVYIDNAVYAGVLNNAESGEDGFLYLKHWKKYLIDKDNERYLNNDTRQESCAVIPMRSVQHYYYEYIPRDAEQLPNEVI